MEAVVLKWIDRLKKEYHRRCFYLRDKWMINSLDLPRLTECELDQINDVWPFVKVNEKDLIWIRYYKKQFGFDPYYITDYQFEYILHRLNARNQVISLENKAMFDVYFPQIPFPHCYLKCINGVLWAEGEVIGQGGYIGSRYLMNKQIDSIVIKPTIESGRGKGVKIVDLRILEDKRASLSSLLDSYGENYVIQEVIHQHNDMGRLNIKSVNCCRITSMLISGVFSYSSIIKFGKRDSYIDNWDSGFMVGINCDGTLKGTAYDSSLNEITEVNGEPFIGMAVPQFSEIIANVKLWHTSLFPQVGIIGWDIIVSDENEVKVIEVNLASPGIVGEQLCSGPFFCSQRDSIIRLFE